MMTILGSPVLEVLFQVVGLACLSAAVAGAIAFVFRWRTGTTLPEGPTLLLALGAVAVYLNTRLALVHFLQSQQTPLEFETVLLNLGILVVSGFTAAGGWYVGDRLGASERFSTTGLHTDWSPLVRATGRFITVTLPEDVGDINGYDPVAPETKTALATRTYDFPRGLTVEQLQSALATRLKADYDVGHIDADINPDGTLEYLAVGRRVSGIGPTLSPGSRATAIVADPAFSASPGDTVQVWDGEAGERVGTGELRAAVDRTATISAREDVVAKLEPEVEYRLMTLSSDERVDRTFASMLRRAEKTMSIIDVREGAHAVGMTVDETGMSVIAITSAEGTTTTLPERTRSFDAGDRIFVIGHPTNLRRLEASATGETPYEQPTRPDRSPKAPTRRRLRDRLLGTGTDG